MHCGESNPTVTEAATLLEVVRAISGGGLGAVSVVDATGRLAGVITDGDLRRALERGRLEEIGELRGGSIMTRAPVVTGPDELAYAALQLMENRPSQISVLPVVDAEQRPVGLLRLHDIIRSGL
jgi:arabinose-5-phosphate isomerase